MIKNKAQRDYRKNNYDEYIEYQRRYRKENPEILKILKRNYYILNRDKILKKKRDDYRRKKTNV